MIELPDKPKPSGVEATLLDYGFIQRPASGGSALRVDRPGSRYQVTVAYPPMQADVARKFVARLQRARREGLRIEYPLLGLSQGVPGVPVVDGAGQSGTTLDLHGLNPGYQVRQGFWLNVTDADGARYLHNVSDDAIVGSDGRVTVEIEPAIRAPLTDGAAVELRRPTVEGMLVESLSWSLSVDRLIRLGGSIVIEEVA